MAPLLAMAALFSAAMAKSEEKSSILVHRMRFVALFHAQFWA
jgi:hypothetical protein